MVHIRRLAAIASKAALIVSALLAAPAAAEGGDPPPVGNVQIGPGSLPLGMYPIVTVPGASGAVRVGLATNTPVGGSATVQATVWCWRSDLEQVSQTTEPKTVWVPSDGNLTSIDKYVTFVLATPAECVPIATPELPVDATYAVTIAVPGFEPWGLSLNNSLFGKPFTRTNIRYNLDLRQDITDAQLARYQAHHTLPNRFRDWFTERGFVIDDPVYLRWWCSKPGVEGNHPSMWRDYNRRWATFIEEHPNASREQILTFRKQVQGVDKYRYICPGDQLPPAPVPYYRAAAR